MSRFWQFHVYCGLITSIEAGGAAMLTEANILHRHRHAHDDVWHEHPHQHPDTNHMHECVADPFY